MKTIKISDDNTKTVQGALKEKRKGIIEHIDNMRGFLAQQLAPVDVKYCNEEIETFQEALLEINDTIALFK